MFTMLQNSCRDKLGKTLKLNRILIDFEQAVASAVTKMFPDCEISYCHFHFSQCIYRKIQGLGLAKDYGRNVDDIYTTVRSIMALPFLPESEIEEVFEQISSEVPERLNPLLDYVNRNFVDSAARFKKKRWSVFPLLSRGIPRTTNRAESWNSRLNNAVNCKHPGLLKLIDALKLEESNMREVLVRVKAGHEWPCKIKTVDVVREQRIQSVFEQYDTYDDKEEYVRMISYNLKK